jgi:sec-independent protein translocase protein TatA
MRFGGMGGWEWIIILVIVIIIFGVGKLPQVGSALGQSIREFREASKKNEGEDEDEDEDETSSATSEGRAKI